MQVQNFITLCDGGFLAFALTMLESLRLHFASCRCYILCMDSKAYNYLSTFGPKWITPINLKEIETPELLKVKNERTKREYCWTLSSHCFEAVKKRNPDAESITYLDADMFFLRSPNELFEELKKQNKSILITDHHYAPEYDASSRSGRYCVQYLTILNNQQAWDVINEWKSQCLDWCYARLEDGKFGDQMYLNDWPFKHQDIVHVANPPDRFIAPWNVDMVSKSINSSQHTLYHFQGARYVGEKRIILGIDHKIPRSARTIFDDYGKRLSTNIDLLKSNRLSTTVFPLGRRGPLWYRKWIRILRRNLVIYEW